MRTNHERRRRLLDAAIAVLADQGARGLTFRSVDAGADVPAGTTSNYFADRPTLLEQATARVIDRLAPSATDLAEITAAPRDRAGVALAMHRLLERVDRDRPAYLALLELRLEATRDDRVRALIGTHLRANLGQVAADHQHGGFPGDRGAAIALYLAVSGLLTEVLTLPEVLADTGEAPGTLVDDLVARLLPDALPDGPPTEA